MPMPPAPLSAETIDKIRVLRREGRSYAAIAEALVREGVQAARGGVSWHAATVRTALNSARRRHARGPQTRPQPADAPRAQPTTKGAPKATPVAANGKSDFGRLRDTRGTMAASEIAKGLVAGARALEAVVEPKGHRWPAAESYPALRQAFHVLPDAERRTILARLVGEEAARIEHDAGASFNRGTS